MTATEPASLDALDAAMRMHDVQYARANRIEAERDQARTIAVTLEQECADKDRRITEALGLLADALVWATDANTADCVQEAIAALKGED